MRGSSSPDDFFVEVYQTFKEIISNLYKLLQKIKSISQIIYQNCTLIIPKANDDDENMTDQYFSS